MAKKEEAPANAETPAAEPAPKKGGKMVVLLLLVNILLVGGLAAYLFLFGGLNGGKAKTNGKEGEAAVAAEGEKKEGGGEAKEGSGGEGGAVKGGPMGPVVEFDPFIVNLDEAGQTRYLKTTLQFEMSNAQAAAETKSRTVAIRDLVITYLSSLNFTQTQGQVNKEIIRTSIIKRVNTLIKEGEVKNLYFTDFVIQ